MGTSVAMLEQYYGHTTNVGMVEELAKPKTLTTERFACRLDGCEQNKHARNRESG